ncbi:hypothetical protein AAHE18_16G096500 [Arachis hypogaea]
MQTRSKTGNRTPKALQVAKFSVSSNFDLLPKSIQSALHNPLWRDTMLTEYKALLYHDTWSLVELPENEKVVGCKWIFAVKKNAKGEIIRHKARLVAKGFLQTAGIDFDQIFSPVIKPVTIRMIFTMHF